MTPHKDPSLWQTCVALIGTTMEGEVTWLERKIIYGACLLAFTLAGLGYSNFSSRLTKVEDFQMNMLSRMTRVETVLGISVDLPKMEAKK